MLLRKLFGDGDSVASAKGVTNSTPGPEPTLALQKDGGKDDKDRQNLPALEEVSQRMDTASCQLPAGECRGGGELTNGLLLE